MRMRMMVLVMGMTGLWAQTAYTQQSAAQANTQQTASQEAPRGPVVMKTFHLANASQVSEQNEILTALRNMMNPHDHIFLVSSENAIVVQATQADLDMVQQVLSELDRPKKTYRLTYTVTEKDGDRRLGTQHFSMIVVAGQRTVLKQGSKIPIVTGSVDDGGKVNSAFTYADVGMNFDVTLDEFANGVRLRSHVEDTGVPEEKTTGDIKEPVIRQTVLDGTAFLAPGKPMMLGSLDVPGSTRHLDIEVVMEQAL